MTSLTRTEAIQCLRAIQRNERDEYGNEEVQHIAADSVLCNLLLTLGYADVVAEYEKIEKYYA